MVTTSCQPEADPPPAEAMDASNFRLQYIAALCKSEDELFGILNAFHMDLVPEKRVHPFYASIIIATVLILAGTGFYLLGIRWQADVDQAGNSSRTGARSSRTETFDLSRTSASGGLGAELYEQSANPVGDSIPDVAPQVTNPMEGIYNNPFE